MWQPLKEYFNFTKKERHGIIYIVSIIFILIILPFFFPFFAKEKSTDFTEFAKEIAQLKVDSSSRKINSKYKEEYYNDYTPEYKKHVASTPAKLFYFDPNTATTNDWIRLGIKPHTAQTIQHYIAKGGKFYKATDIKKIFGLRESDAARLIPYVVIKNIPKEFSYSGQYQKAEKISFKKKDVIEKVHINIADTSAYISLPGIGSKLSKRIISFREKLGGFYSIDQVGETYLLPDSTFQKIKKYLVLDNKKITKININTASVDEMNAHPYIKYQVANAIFQYRNQHGDFNSVEEIKHIMIVDNEIYNKISPYLSIE